MKKTERQREQDRLEFDSTNRVKMISRKLTELYSEVVKFELGYTGISRVDIGKIDLSFLLKTKAGLKKIMKQLNIK